MVRTQVRLTEEQARTLRRMSSRSGRSVADLIREAVDRLVDARGSDERWARALAAVGVAVDESADVGGAHDRYLAQVLADDLR